MAAKRPDTSAAEIVETALSMKGKIQYVFGGGTYPRLDCSSYVGRVLGLCGVKLPLGMTYKNGSHGPAVISYVAWRGAVTVPSPQAGDLCIWAGLGPLGHIGIAVSATHCISALNPEDGCQITPIADTGPRGAPLIFRRVIGAAGGGGLSWTGGGAAAGAGAVTECHSAAASSAANFALVLVLLFVAAMLVQWVARQTGPPLRSHRALLGAPTGGPAGAVPDPRGPASTLASLQLGRVRDQHRPGPVTARDHEHMEPRQLLDRLAHMPVVAAHALRDGLNHVRVTGRP